MANFAIHRPGRPRSALEGVPRSIAAGYGLGKDIRDRNAQREYAEVLAGAPEAGLGIPEDTEVTSTLREDYADFADESGVLPAQQQTEIESTQKQARLTTDDWAAYRKEGARAAAATGDPNAVREFNKYVTELQHEGFMKNIDMATQLVMAGDTTGAIKYLEDANEYMPNLSHLKFTEDGAGNIIGQSYDERTGEPMGMLAFNKDTLPKFTENFRDPKKFAFWNWEQSQRDADLDKTKSETFKNRQMGKYYGGGGSRGGTGGGTGMKEKDRYTLMSKLRGEITAYEEQAQMMEEGPEREALVRRAEEAQMQLNALSGGPLPLSEAYRRLEGVPYNAKDAAQFQRVYPGAPMPEHWGGQREKPTDTAIPGPEVSFDAQADIAARQQFQETTAGAAAEEKALRAELGSYGMQTKVATTPAHRADTLRKLSEFLRRPDVKGNEAVYRDAQTIYKKLLDQGT